MKALCRAVYGEDGESAPDLVTCRVNLGGVEEDRYSTLDCSEVTFAGRSLVRGMNADLTEEAIDAARARGAEIEVAIQAQYGGELARIAALEERARNRAMEIVYASAHLTGYPYRGSHRIDEATITETGVDVTVERYEGEGVWEPSTRVEFPRRWLALPDAAWKAELREKLEVEAKELQEREERVKAKVNAEREARERALLADLLARYPQDS